MAIDYNDPRTWANGISPYVDDDDGGGGDDPTGVISSIVGGTGGGGSSNANNSNAWRLLNGSGGAPRQSRTNSSAQNIHVGPAAKPSTSDPAQDNADNPPTPVKMPDLNSDAEIQHYNQVIEKNNAMGPIERRFTSPSELSNAINAREARRNDLRQDYFDQHPAQAKPFFHNAPLGDDVMDANGNIIRPGTSKSDTTTNVALPENGKLVPVGKATGTVAAQPNPGISTRRVGADTVSGVPQDFQGPTAGPGDLPDVPAHQYVEPKVAEKPYTMAPGNTRVTPQVDGPDRHYTSPEKSEKERNVQTIQTPDGKFWAVTGKNDDGSPILAAIKTPEGDQAGKTVKKNRFDELEGGSGDQKPSKTWTRDANGKLVQQ